MIRIQIYYMYSSLFPKIIIAWLFGDVIHTFFFWDQCQFLKLGKRKS
jgi:hypothetical protein